MVLVFVCAMRFGYRGLRRSIRNGKLLSHGKCDRVMIVGAGDMGMIIIKELEAGGKAKKSSKGGSANES